MCVEFSYLLIFSEILLEERVSDCETMKRENRRVAAMSWGAGDDTPPPKPNRVPQTDSSSFLSVGESSVTPQTYIIAQNAAVLAQLMRENENRPLNPSAYTTPASVFNTLAVDIDGSKTEPTTNESPMLPLKTIMLPACELFKLNPTIDNAHKNESNVTSLSRPEEQRSFASQIKHNKNNINSQAPAIYPIPCKINQTSTQQIHGIEPTYIALQTADICQNLSQSHNLPPHSGESVLKSRSLERNLQLNATYASRISSLDRIQNAAQVKQARSNSFTRQLSSGNEISGCISSGVSLMGNVRSASLERGSRIGTINYGFRTNSFECGNSQPICSQYAQYIPNEVNHGGSLERNQSMNNSQNINMRSRNLACGSLERNQQGIFSCIHLEV